MVRGGASLITQRLQQQYLNNNGGRAESFFSRYWGTSLDDAKSLNQATQSAYDYILDNYNKDDGKEVEDGQIIIEGYSYGCVLANYLAKRLKEAKLEVNLLVTVDAAASPESSKVDREISSNVKKNINYYQTNPSAIRSRGDKNKKEMINQML